MTSEYVSTETEDRITRIRLVNARRRNALSLEAMQDITKALRDLPAESRIVIIEAEGPAFSAGHDIGEMIDREPKFYDDLFSVCTDMMETVHSIPQPVIAKVDGIATAAGCQLVATCDLAFASDRSTFATPGVKIGLFCTTPMVPVIRSVGRKRSMDMLLTGRPIPAATAAEWGLINAAVPAEDLDATVADIARRIIQYSGDTIGIGKQAFYAQIDLPESQAYEVTKPIMADNATTADAQEGMTAFLEKRQPSWQERE